MIPTILTIFATATIVAWAVTAAVRGGMLRAGVLDVPNVRSSHTQPTPTLGGIGIIAGSAAGLAIAYGVLGLPPPPFLQALGGSTLILGVLCYDEIRPMGRFQKLVVQAGATLLLVGAGVVLRKISLPGVGEIALGPLAMPVTVLWLFAVQNLYNFMDGIDGIAGSEGLIVAGLICGLSVTFTPVLTPQSAAIAGGALGFLFLNAPPARIFMGDAGGHFLGLTLGAFAIIGEGHGIPFVVTAMFLGAFLYDSIYTILRRLIRRENITLAHRSHLYQRLNIMGWTHLRVDVAFAVCTLLLGGSGYLVAFGQTGAGIALGGVIAGAMVVATVWIERRWRSHEEAQ